ncbi:MAG TPA: GMC family oxidoreductase [Bryobacteraceae bacterium]|nr:GMC family oxidoreductase [Bryobacteraceae bacterium]
MANKRNTTGGAGNKLSRRDLLKKSAAYAGGIAAMASGSQAAPPSEAEYIVIGSGPGGGPLACNLAKAGHRVVLMEAGTAGTDPDLNVEMKVPILFAVASADPRIAWNYYVRHYADDTQQKLDSKYVAAQGGILYPRASTVGGCGVHNVLVMTYPSNSDWENIANITNDESWAPDKMRNYFQRMEQCRYTTPAAFGAPDTARHGFDGWQTTELADPQIFLADAQITQMIQAAASTMGKAGDFTKYTQGPIDCNDYAITQNDTPGLYTLPMSRLNGARWSVRDHVLETAANYPNLTVMTDCLVTKVIMEGHTATGVEYTQTPHAYRASPMADPKAGTPVKQVLKASREVIISAGTFNSPQILKLSGIGPASELSQFGIHTVVDLGGVGAGMMDRYEIGVVSQLKAPYGIFNQCNFGAQNDACFGNWLQGKGVYTTNLGVISGLLKSNPSRADRDLCIILLPGQFKGYYPGWQNDFLNPTLYTWLVLKAHNVNRAGTVKLQSADPRDTPLITFHSFTEGTDGLGDDLASVVSGVQTCRQMNSQLASITAKELVPGSSVQSANDIGTFVKNEAWGHHASCSNRMGASDDATAVVDSNFKVFGTKNLRVVDASVFPQIPGYFPMIPIMMMSEKASDVILADARGKGRGK